ncbi:MAG: type II toxin-antitoxin system VapC family toxin [Vulcanimicrobiaceae bacterium]
MSAYLLDTNVLLWLFLRSDRVKKSVRDKLADPANTVYVSAVSTWEVAIKAATGKLRLPGEPARYLPARIARAKLSTLAVTLEHTYGVFALPPHHSDPFDRLLVAQAQLEGLTIVTADRALARYDVRTLAV